MARLDHIGIAVDDVESVIECFDDLLGIRPYKDEKVPRQEVRTHFLDTTIGKLEFLESLEEGSPVHKYLERWGEGVHHVAFEVTDLEVTMERLEDAGFTLVNETPQPGADDKRVAFVHPRETHGVLVEFCETTTPPSWTPTTVSHRDGDLAYYERGNPDNPCILFLHGAGGTTLLDTAPLMRHLVSQYHVVGVDFCGHGDTSIPDDETVTMDRFVDDARAALDAVDRASCHLFGFSLGSSVALKVAAESPDRVDRMALFAPNGRWNNELVDTLNRHLNFDALKRHIPKQAERLVRHHQDAERLFPLLLLRRRLQVGRFPRQILLGEFVLVGPLQRSVEGSQGLFLSDVDRFGVRLQKGAQIHPVVGWVIIELALLERLDKGAGNPRLGVDLVDGHAAVFTNPTKIIREAVSGRKRCLFSHGGIPIDRRDKQEHWAPIAKSPNNTVAIVATQPDGLVWRIHQTNGADRRMESTVPRQPPETEPGAAHQGRSQRSISELPSKETPNPVRGFSKSPSNVGRCR